MSRKGKRKAAGKLPYGFDIDDPALPKELERRALTSGGYPYEEPLKRKPYEESLYSLQSELIKLQEHVERERLRVVLLFEGRDTAGKGGTIARFLEHLSTRHARAVALDKPSEVERGQWYFQRYIAHLPTAGEIVLFDRSWYNRAGVERVMGFASPDQVADFLRDVPNFEELLARDGILLIKFFLTLGREMQLARFHERRHDPFKRWKLSPIDIAAMTKWDEYTVAQDEMFRYTHTATCPWFVVRANDQRRARLEAIRWVLDVIPYAGRDEQAVGEPDPLIVAAGPGLLGERE